MLIQVSALAGAALVLGAFVVLQRGFTTSASAGYLWANFVGSSLLCVVAIIDRRLGFIVLEAAWAGVSLWSMFRPTAAPTRPS